MGTGRGLVAALLALALSAVVSAADRPHIDFAEKITVNAGTTQTQFDAYGRRFALNLQSNDRALARLRLKQGDVVAGTRLWRGTLDGQPGSWVRLTERGGASEGVIWDGRDLYVVTRYQNVADSLGVPLAALPDETVIFRLSDSTNLLPSGYCATGPSADGLEANNSLVQYRNMVAELKMQAIAPSTRQLEISMIADSALASRISATTDFMLAVYNIVDGIFGEQLGLLIVPADMRTMPANADPFTSTNPSTLLGQLETYRRNTPAIASLGLAHLMTGHDLDGDLAGIARLGGACQANEAISLSEGWLSTVTTALVMAHEIGHNLGAEHDGSGACVTVPDSFLMSPYINGSHTLSQCSLDAMNAFLATASCLTPAVFAKVELPQTERYVSGQLDVPLIVPFDMHSTGTRTVNDVTLAVRLPESFEFTAVTPDVTCAPATDGLSCDVGSLNPGEERRVELTFVPRQQGSFHLEASVSASNNQNTRDTTQMGSIWVQANTDSSVEVATSTPAALLGDLVDVTLTVRSLTARAVLGASVLVYGGGLRGESVDAPAGVTCQYDVNFPGRTLCSLGDIPGGETRTIVVHSRATEVGYMMLGRAELSTSNDTNPNNNQATFTMSVGDGHDVGLEHVTIAGPVQFNMPYEYHANLRSYGSEPVDGVRVELYFSMFDAAGSISSVRIGGNACTQLAASRYECQVGTMAAREVLPISVSGIATGLGEARVTIRSFATINDNTSNDMIHDTWLVRYGLDASVTSGSVFSAVEGQEESGVFSVVSNGLQPTSGAVLNVEFPEQVRLTRISVSYGATASCSIIDPRHVRCNYDVPEATSYSVTYFAVGEVPGSYQARATLDLPGDENPANNNIEWPMTVAPAIDAGVRLPVAPPMFLLTGQTVTIPFEVFTGLRPVAGVTFEVRAGAGGEISSMSTDSGTCSRVDARHFACTFGDLAGGSVVSLSGDFTTTDPVGFAYVDAIVSAVGDNVSTNNFAHVSMTITEPGDLSLTMGSTTVTATAGAEYALPSILVSRQGPVVNGWLRITIPEGVTPVSMSAISMVCSGSGTIECSLPYLWSAGYPLQLDFRLFSATPGNYVVNVKVTSSNDITNTNDEANIAITVNAAHATPPPNPPPSGGGSGGSKSGGGGRIEWPATVLLGLMLLYRRRRAALHPRRAQLRQNRAC